MLIEEILNICCRHYGVTSEQIKSQKRDSNLVLPRHVTMFVMQRCGRFGMMEIARLFQRDHATVSHALDKIGQQLKGQRVEPKLRSDVDYLLNTTKVLLDRDIDNTHLDAPGYKGLTCVPTYQLSLSDDENGWLYWMWMGRGDIQKFNGGWILNAKMYYEAWKRGNFSIGSERIRSILEKVQSSHSHVLIVPLSSEVKCPTRTTAPVLSSAETIPATRGS